MADLKAAGEAVRARYNAAMKSLSTEQRWAMQLNFEAQIMSRYTSSTAAIRLETILDREAGIHGRGGTTPVA